jgi:hypothetical protein
VQRRGAQVDAKRNTLLLRRERGRICADTNHGCYERHADESIGVFHHTHMDNSIIRRSTGGRLDVKRNNMLLIVPQAAQEARH